MESFSTQLIDLGLPTSTAETLSFQLKNDLKKYSPEACWQRIVHEMRALTLPFAVHQLLYKTVYPDWNTLPRPAFIPEESFIKTTHIAKLMDSMGFMDYSTLHRWSTESYPAFWQTMVKLLGIVFDRPYKAIVNLSQGIESPQWFPDAKLNIANSCFQAPEKDIAIISQTEKGEITQTSYSELNKQSNRVANSITRSLKKGERVAIIMPMNVEAVSIYLGIIKAGCTVVPIPDSFSAEEIAARLRIAKVSWVFCQDYLIRDGKTLPLYEKIIEANAPFTVILSADKKLKSTMLRTEDKSWEDFLSDNTVFTPLSCDPSDSITILFSSGTTGEPKAIPWTQTTPIKCASDAYLHQNIHAGDVFCWPSNLGWMMGPWLIFASLINKATMALYEGTPNGRPFGQFIEAAKVTHLGVVPTLVKTWRNTKCMEGLDWRAIQLFSSTGERSNTEDMLYLMWLVNYRPIIEYCGGTEIGGAYITSTVIQPLVPAACTTPALGLDFEIVDEEIIIVPPSIGLSTTLLNADHHDVYYADVPMLSNGKIGRRHGDQAKYYANGFYRLLGRVDDTMKLGGIKVSSAEIENILNALPEVDETAAIAIAPPEGGPSQLVIYAVLKTPGSTQNELKVTMQKAIKQSLNPLFKIHEVVVITALPRTASNKIMRRVLRDRYQKQSVDDAS